MCRQAGVTLAATIDEAFDARRGFATQPLPAGPNTVVLTTAGGWGVLTADAITRSRSAPRRAARRPPRRDRRQAAAALEPGQPDRPRGGGDPRHDPRGARAGRRAPRRSTRSCSSASACSRTRPGSCARAASRPMRASSASRRSTNGRTRATPQAAADVSDATGKPILCASELADQRPGQPGAARGARDAGGTAGRRRTEPSRSLEHAWRYAHRRAVTGRGRRRMTPARRWIAAVLAIGAVVAVVLAFTGDPSASGAAPAPAGATPLWSPRRVPQPIVDAVGAQRLQGALDTRSVGLDRASMVEDDGAPVAAHDADSPLIPASAQKLYVAAAALDVLGPDFTYETKAWPRGADNGTVDQLMLVGSGDPVHRDRRLRRRFLAAQPRRKTDVFTHLETLADAIVDAGVRSRPRRRRRRRLAATTRNARSTGGRRATSPTATSGPLGALDVNGGYRRSTPRRPPTTRPSTPRPRLTDLLTATRRAGRGRRRAARRRPTPSRSRRSRRRPCATSSRRCSPRATPSPPRCSPRSWACSVGNAGHHRRRAPRPIVADAAEARRAHRRPHLLDALGAAPRQPRHVPHPPRRARPRRAAEVRDARGRLERRRENGHARRPAARTGPRGQAAARRPGSSTA